MKKLLIFLALALGYSSLGYAMDNTDRQAKINYGLFRKFIAKGDWRMCATQLRQETNQEYLLEYKRILLATSAEVLNHISDEGGLFGILFSLLEKHQLREHFFRELLRDLICKGLDCTVQHNGQYEYHIITFLNEIMPDENHYPVGIQSNHALLDAIRKHKAQQIAKQRKKDQKMVAAVFKTRCMIFGSVAAGLALTYAVYRWYTQKVDKDEQEEDPNEDNEHDVVNVHEQNSVAV